MRPSTIWYTLKQGVKNIKRNWMFSLASIITMAACIFLVGVFYSLVTNVDNIAHKVEQEVPITVFFDEGTTDEQMQEVGNLIQKLPDVIQIICQAVPALPGADLGMRGRHKLQFTDDQGDGITYFVSKFG